MDVDRGGRPAPHQGNSEGEMLRTALDYVHEHGLRSAAAPIENSQGDRGTGTQEGVPCLARVVLRLLCHSRQGSRRIADARQPPPCHGKGKAGTLALCRTSREVHLGVAQQPPTRVCTFASPCWLSLSLDPACSRCRFIHRTWPANPNFLSFARAAPRQNPICAHAFVVKWENASEVM